jgi:hypothetical protein
MPQPPLRNHVRPGLALLLAALATAAVAQETAAPEKPPAPPIATMSALAFAPDGTLFVGDARNGAVFALDLGARPRRDTGPEVRVADLETKIAALIGTRAEDVVVHDLAVDPLSLDVYLAVSRNRGRWTIDWNLPNDLGDATELLRIGDDGRLQGIELAGVAWTRKELPRPIASGRAHPWKEGVDLRTEAITDLAWDDGQIWVAGLSNEEFSSAIWRVAYPFSDAPAAMATVENYHVAHRKWETEAPVRSLVPYTFGGKKHLIAAYLCTPIVVFPTADLEDGAHVRGRTVAELGSGNYPLDLVAANTRRGDRLFLANSNLPLMILDPKEIEGAPALTEPAEGYTAGVEAEYRSGVGMQQLDVRGNAQLVILRRVGNGTLGLETWPLAR